MSKEDRAGSGGKRLIDSKPKGRNTLFHIVILVIVVLILACAVVFVRTMVNQQHSPEKPANTSPTIETTAVPRETPETETMQATETALPTESAEEEIISTETPATESSAVSEGDNTDTDTDVDLLMLVNPWNSLPEDYSIELTTLSNGKQLATVIYPSLQQMFDDMRAQEVYPVVASGFRSAEKQQSLMDEKIQSFVDQGYSQEAAEAEAELWVAKVGYSEHQTGLAVDINADGIHSTGQEVYDWLAEHAWEYGFILRFPEGKTDITGIDYEPWHYRYVGVEAAKEIYQQGVTLEEYLSSAAATDNNG